MDFFFGILNSSAFAAFIGAFSAFMLVIANDRRRDRRTIITIKNEISMNREHAAGKLKTLEMNKTALTSHNKVIPARIIGFNAEVIRGLSSSVLHRLTPDHRRALDALCYMMETTDGVLNEAYETANRFRSGLTGEERIELAKVLLDYYTDGIINTRRLVEMCGLFLDGDYSTILTKQYAVEDYT